MGIKGWTLLFLVGIVVSAASARAEDCVPPVSGLMSWWPAEGNANDIISANNGTLINGVTFAPGVVGQAFNFNGVDQSVVVEDAANLRMGDGEITLEAWINAPPGATSRTIVAKMNPATPFQNYYLKVAEDDALEFGAFDCGTASCGFGGPGKQPVKSISPVADNTFHHVAGARRANGDLEVYVDGKLDNSITGQPSNNTDSSARLGIGGVNGQQLFNGLIDEVDVYKRALTAAEIRDIVAAGNAGKCRSASVASWTLACFDSVMLSDCVFNDIQFDPSLVSTSRSATVASPDGHASMDLLSIASASYGRLGADSELVARGNNIVGHLSYLLSYAFMDDTLIISAPGQSGVGVAYVDFRYQGGGGGDRGSPMQGGPYASPTLWFYSGPAPQQDWTLSARDAFAPQVEGTVMGSAVPFTFNSPFPFHAAILAQVELHCNPGMDTGELACQSWEGTGFANFSNVATISSIRVFNFAGDPVTNFSITAQSGTNYGAVMP